MANPLSPRRPVPAREARVVEAFTSYVVKRQRKEPGFTLLEVVLAIGLCGAVMALLTSAIDLYLVRVDTSRTRVETAQLARALLNEIADDLRAARYSTKNSSSALGTSGGQNSSGGDRGTGSTAQTVGTATDLGIYGTLTELRIDRTAQSSWRQVAVPSAQLSADADPDALPQTVEYFFVQGRVMPSADFAAGGVSVDTSLEGFTGLYRKQTPTAAMLTSTSATSFAGTAQSGGAAEFLAPEVVQLTFRYSDGAQWYEEWDSAAQQDLPAAVEITISLFSDTISRDSSRRERNEEDRRRDQSRWVEYRSLVRIPRIDEPQQLGEPSSAGTQPPPQGGGRNAN
jgi:type II secretory pathway pseudopilin PulG